MPSRQQSRRASGVACQPAHCATAPCTKARAQATEITRLRSDCTLLGCAPDRAVSNKDEDEAESPRASRWQRQQAPETESADRGCQSTAGRPDDLGPLEATAGDRRRARHCRAAEAERTERTADGR